MSTNTNRPAVPGFTLIELLIVVAIISILAAIAIPNYLEAQVRAKVARVVSEMRSLALALEIYASDHDSYPPNSGAQWDLYPGDAWGIWVITTPIPYMSSPPEDVFAMKRGEAGTLTCQSPPVCWMYGTWTADGESVSEVGDGVRGSSYVIGSLGPNLMEDCINDWPGGDYRGMFVSTRPKPIDTDLIGGDGLAPDYFYVYDPSNGTISYGDIFRKGP